MYSSKYLKKESMQVSIKINKSRKENITNSETMQVNIKNNQNVKLCLLEIRVTIP